MRTCRRTLLVLLATMSTLGVTSANVRGTFFDRCVTIVFENADYATAAAQPYFASLAQRPDARLLTNCHGCARSSLPNWLCQIASTTFGVTSDTTRSLAGSSLVDLFDKKGVTWKGYFESYNGNCNLADWQNPSTIGGNGYARKNNPFLNMANIINNATRCARVVPSSQLDTDIASNTVPNYVYFMPNQYNDGHNTNINVAATWLKSFLQPKLTNANFYNTRTLIVITIDESSTSGPTNQIYTLLLGRFLNSNAQPSKDAACYTHASEVRTVEENWGLGSLNKADAQSNWFLQNRATLRGSCPTTF